MTNTTTHNPGQEFLISLERSVYLRNKCNFIYLSFKKQYHTIQSHFYKPSSSQSHSVFPQVDLLKTFMKDNLNKEDEEWMRFCCLAMDTNAFELLRVLDDGTVTNLRGLYALAAIMNHDCSPNTTHHYDRNGVMKVESRFIIIIIIQFAVKTQWINIIK